MLKENLFLIIGISAGIVASQVSIGLTGFSGIPVLGPTLGYTGFMLNLVHGMPGYFMATSVNLLEQGSVMSITDKVIVEVFNGLLSASVYGFIGYSSDVEKT